MQMLSAVIGIEIGCLLAVMPIECGRQRPGGQFAIDVQIGGHGQPSILPQFVGGFHGIVVFVIVGSRLAFQFAIGVGLVFEILAAHGEISREHGTTDSP